MNNNFLDLSKFKACKCGAHIESETTDVKISYTWLGWFWWSMGTTAIPKEISFTCTKCDMIFEKITDKELIKYYIFFRKH